MTFLPVSTVTLSASARKPAGVPPPPQPTMMRIAPAKAVPCSSACGFARPGLRVRPVLVDRLEEQDVAVVGDVAVAVAVDREHHVRRADAVVVGPVVVDRAEPQLPHV